MQSGDVLANRTRATQLRQLVRVNRQGDVLGEIGPRDEFRSGNPELSPDGLRVAVVATTERNIDVWIIDVMRGVRTRFTSDPNSDGGGAVWSPDGRRVLFNSNRNGVYDLFEKAVGGEGVETPLHVTAEEKRVQSISPVPDERPGPGLRRAHHHHAQLARDASEQAGLLRQGPIVSRTPGGDWRRPAASRRFGREPPCRFSGEEALRFVPTRGICMYLDRSAAPNDLCSLLLRMAVLGARRAPSRYWQPAKGSALRTHGISRASPWLVTLLPARRGRRRRPAGRALRPARGRASPPPARVRGPSAARNCRDSDTGGGT
ncbi:MAG: PD40 domain-containing protein [Acidobacteria bacterium]|nr:PD40 domain-containing protein [Acidobacteriota bacterium]